MKLNADLELPWLVSNDSFPLFKKQASEVDATGEKLPEAPDETAKPDEV